MVSAEFLELLVMLAHSETLTKESSRSLDPKPSWLEDWSRSLPYFREVPYSRASFAFKL